VAHLLSRRDLDFLLYEWLDITSLTDRDRFSARSRDTFDGVLDLSSEMAGKLFAPHNKAGDQSPPRLGDDGRVELIDDVKTALDAYAAADLIAAPADDDQPRIDGMVPGREPGHLVVRLTHHRQCQPARRARIAGANRHLGPPHAARGLLRHDVPV